MSFLEPCSQNGELFRPLNCEMCSQPRIAYEKGLTGLITTGSHLSRDDDIPPYFLQSSYTQDRIRQVHCVASSIARAGRWVLILGHRISLPKS